MFKFTKEILDSALTYSDFIDLNKSILNLEFQEAPYNKQVYLDYTIVNFNRTEKILRNFQLDKKLYNTLSENIDNWTWVLINEPWCGDASFTLPVLYAMSVASAGTIDFKIVLRDKEPEVIENFLTNGGKSIPKLVCLNKNLQVIGTWGPRPKELQDKFKIWKEEGLLEDLNNKIKKVNRWYLKDKNLSIQKEFVEIIKTWKKIQNDK